MTPIRRRHTFVLAALLSLSLALVGCAPASPPPPESDPVETPAEVEGGLDVEIRVPQTDGVGELVLTNARYGPDDELPHSDFDAELGGFLIMDGTWTTVEGLTSMVGFYILAEDATGAEGFRDIFVNQEFAVVDQPAGQSISGEIKFDIGPGPHTIIVLDDASQVISRFVVEAEPQA